MKEKYFLGIAIVFVISLVYSRYMVSVSMIAIMILALLELKKSNTFTFLQFIKSYEFSGLILVFIGILFSGINSEDHTQWIAQLRLKLPFLLLPIAFYILRPISAKTHRIIHFVFLAILLISTFHVLVMFLSDYKAITSSIGKGKSIPTPIDHIHYSIMLAYAVTTSFIFSIISKEKYFKVGLFFLGIYLFLFMHFLSVRTGLALSYTGIGIVLIWFVLKNKKYVFGLIVTALLIAIPFIAFKTIEPFKRKINYMFWDFAQYQQGKGKSYSDSERIMSYVISLELFQEKPLIGHGIGDLRPIMVEKHKEKYGAKEKYIFPHNQFLFILVSIGILGFFVFFLGLFSPLLFLKRRNIFLIAIFSLMLLSFLVENTLQRAVITAFFLFFILLHTSLSRNVPTQANLNA